MRHKSAIVYPNVEIGKNVRIEAGTVIGVPGMIRGADEFNGKVIIGDNCVIGANVTIAVGTEGVTKIGDDCLIMNNALIGHNVEIGNNCEIGGASSIAGHAVIEDNVIIKTGVIVRNRVMIPKGTTVGQGSNVVKSLGRGGLTYVGNPCEIILYTKKCIA